MGDEQGGRFETGIDMARPAQGVRTAIDQQQGDALLFQHGGGSTELGCLGIAHAQKAQ